MPALLVIFILLNSHSSGGTSSGNVFPLREDILKLKEIKESGTLEELKQFMKVRPSLLNVLEDYLLYYGALIALREGDTLLAFDYLKKILRLRPQFHKLKELLLSFDTKTIPGETLIHYIKSYPLYRDSPELLIRIARLEDSLGFKSDSKKHFAQFVRRYPWREECIDILDRIKVSPALRARVLYLNGYYKEVLKIHSGELDVQYYKLLSLYKLKKYREFLRAVYKRGRKFDRSRRRRLYFYAGIAGEYIGRYALSTRFLLDAVKLGDRWSVYELTNFLFEKRGDWAYSKLLQSIDEVPVGENRLFDLRRGILLFVFGDRRYEEFLKSSLDTTGFVRYAALYWLFRTTGDSSYYFYLGDEAPLSYYFLKLNPSFIPGEDIEMTDNVGERIKALLILGEREEVLKSVRDGRVAPAPLLLFSGSVGDYFTSIWCYVKMGKRPIRKFLPYVFPMPFEDIVDSVSELTGVEREILWALMREESWFRVDAVSPRGALGLMQLLPSTARRVLGRDDLDTSLIMAPHINVYAGALYLKELIEEFESYTLALAAYNAGEERVRDWLKRLGEVEDDIFIEFIPYGETRNYVRRVMRSYYLYKLLTSRRLQF